MRIVPGSASFAGARVMSAALALSEGVSCKLSEDMDKDDGLEWVVEAVLAAEEGCEG